MKNVGMFTCKVSSLLFLFECFFALPRESDISWVAVYMRFIWILCHDPSHNKSNGYFQPYTANERGYMAKQREFIATGVNKQL